uniref:Uncharacterized protein n=1 Tax=Arundo donax TaxID=35708 RepID=A0A0A9A395_ARUDO
MFSVLTLLFGPGFYVLK